MELNNRELGKSYHVTMQLPSEGFGFRIRAYFRYRKLYPLLYRAAWKTWNEYSSQAFPTTTSGAVIALHSAGSLMNHHPHLHGIHLDGSIDASGNFQQLPEINPQELESSFADNLLSSLYRDGVLPFEVIENMASWQHSGFSVTMGNLDKESLRVRPASLSKMRGKYENQSIHPRPKRNLQIH